MNSLLLSLLLVFTVASKSAAQKEQAKKDSHAKQLAIALSHEKGETYEVIRTTGNHAVLHNTDTDEYVALNVLLWDPKTMDSYQQYAAVATDADVVRNLVPKTEWIVEGHDEAITTTEWNWETVWHPENCFGCYEREQVQSTVVIGYKWVDTSHFHTFYDGAGLRFSTIESGTKDLESIAALREDVAKAELKSQFKNRYKLAESRSQELASLTYKYFRMENARELTDLEKDSFALKALGVSMSQIESAVKAKMIGSDDSYQKLLQEAAVVNKTSPEMIGKFFEEVILE